MHAWRCSPTQVCIGAAVLVCTLANAPALPGERGFWLALQYLESNVGHFDPPFHEDLNDINLRIRTTTETSVTIQVGVNWDKYNLNHLPTIQIDGQQVSFSPLEPLRYTVPLDENWGPANRTVLVRVSDPVAAGWGWWEHERFHEYRVHVLQPPDFDKVLLPQQLRVTDGTGGELQPSPLFQHGQRDTTTWRFAVSESTEQVTIRFECSNYTTETTLNGRDVNMSHPAVVNLIHTKTSLMLQCKYTDMRWTSHDLDRTYVLEFEKRFVLNAVDVHLMLSPESGYCVLRQMKNTTAEQTRYLLPSAGKRFVCRSGTSRPSFLAMRVDPRANAFLADPSSLLRYELAEGLPVPVPLPAARLQWTLRLEGGTRPVEYPVEVIHAAFCESMTCPAGMLRRPSLVYEENTQQRLCFNERCGDEDVQHCCLETATCDSYHDRFNCNVGQVVREHADELHCADFRCDWRDEKTCCGQQASCSSITCPHGWEKHHESADVLCSSTTCTSDDAELCCAPVATTTASPTPKPTPAPTPVPTPGIPVVPYAKGSKEKVDKLVAHYGASGCYPHANRSCHNEMCFYDTTCSDIPPRDGGLGCFASGLHFNCRHCGHHHYLPCPEAPSCIEENGCSLWNKTEKEYCFKHFGLTCQEPWEYEIVDLTEQSDVGGEGLVPCGGTFVSSTDTRYTEGAGPWRVGDVWVYGASEGPWFQMVAVDRMGTKVEEKHSRQKLKDGMSEDDLQAGWKEAMGGGAFRVEVKFCGLAPAATLPSTHTSTTHTSTTQTWTTQTATTTTQTSTTQTATATQTSTSTQTSTTQTATTTMTSTATQTSTSTQTSTTTQPPTETQTTTPTLPPTTTQPPPTTLPPTTTQPPTTTEPPTTTQPPTTQRLVPTTTTVDLAAEQARLFHDMYHTKRPTTARPTPKPNAASASIGVLEKMYCKHSTCHMWSSSQAHFCFKNTGFQCPGETLAQVRLLDLEKPSDYYQIQGKQDERLLLPEEGQAEVEGDGWNFALAAVLVAIGFTAAALVLVIRARSGDSGLEVRMAFMKPLFATEEEAQRSAMLVHPAAAAE